MRKKATESCLSACRPKYSKWLKNRRKKISQSGWKFVEWKQWSKKKTSQKSISFKMLETIVVGLLILSALIFGFWQFFVRPSDADDKSKIEMKKKPRQLISRRLFLATTWSLATFLIWRIWKESWSESFSDENIAPTHFLLLFLIHSPSRSAVNGRRSFGQSNHDSQTFML